MDIVEIAELIGKTLVGGTLLGCGLTVVLAVIVYLNRDECPECGEPKPRGRKLCDACEAEAKADVWPL